jgi:hypothetical protein
MNFVAKKVPKELPRAARSRYCKFTTYRRGLQENLLHSPMARAVLLQPRARLRKQLLVGKARYNDGFPACDPVRRSAPDCAVSNGSHTACAAPSRHSLVTGPHPAELTIKL